MRLVIAVVPCVDNNVLNGLTETYKQNKFLCDEWIF